MSRLAWALIFLLAAFLAFRQLAIAAEPIVLDQKIEAPDQLTVGDHFHYIVRVEADAGTNVFLAPGGLPDVLELAKTPTSTTRAKGNGRVEITINLELAAFVPGPLNIDPVQLRFRTRDGAGGDLKTQAVQLNVASVLPANGNVEARDLKPQAEIGTAPAVWILYAIGGAVAALFLVSGLLFWRRRVLKHRAAILEPGAEEEPLTPEDKARGRLDRAGVGFAAAADYTAYYAAIAVTVRNYLTERYGFGAFALTTVELQNEMQRRGIDRWQARLVGGLLTQCDAAVYAGYRPAHERADADLTAAYEIVEMSRPQPPVVEVSVV